MLATLRQRNFALLWIGGIISMIGDWMLFIGLPLYVYNLTNSTLATGITFMIEMLPYVLLSSVAGVFVDRWNRKLILIVADILRAGCILLLLLVSTRDSVWLVYVVASVMATLSQFATPARSALLPSLVDEPHLITANSLTSLSTNLTRLIGPSVGGALIALLGFNSVVVLDSLTFVVSALLLACMRPQPAAAAAAPSAATPMRWSSVWREWWAGLQFVRGDSVVLMVFVIVAAVMPAEGIMRVLYVAFVKQQLGGGSWEYGLLSSATAVGGLLGSLLVVRVGQRLPVHRLVGLSGAANGLLLLAIFNLPSLPLALALSMLAGLAVVGFFVSLTTLLQTRVPDHYRGRVFGAFATTAALTTLLGMGLASALGDLVGVVPLLNLVGLLNILGGLLGLVLLHGVSLTRRVAAAGEAG